MTNAVVEARHDVTVAVVREKGARFQIERASIDPPRPDDVIVRVVATGVCHTDMLVRDQDYPVPLPVVLGHEGSGIVEAVGSAVVGVRPGDHVVMTWPSCGKCRFCVQGHPTIARSSSNSALVVRDRMAAMRYSTRMAIRCTAISSGNHLSQALRLRASATS
jgi:Zn-dependent alcohol dehydrogenase